MFQEMITPKNSHRIYENPVALVVAGGPDPRGKIRPDYCC